MIKPMGLRGSNRDMQALSGSHRSTHIASDLASRGARIAGQTAAGVRITGISHRSILKNTPIFRIAGQHRRDFRRLFFWHFPVISDQANVFSHR